jgi:hypothetical protein
MLRKRSEDLPRYANGSYSPAFHWRRRHLLYALVGILFFFWLLPPNRSSSSGRSDVDWSRYAYSLYATDSATLCHAVLVFDALAQLGSKADRVLFYPESWDTVISDSRDRDSQLLVIAKKRYDVKLQPIRLLTVEGRAQGTTDPFCTPSALAPSPPRANTTPRRFTGQHLGQVGY